MNPYDFTLQVVEEAGEKVLAAREKAFTASHKGADVRDIVTSVDLEINTFILGRIAEAFPEDAMYSEEGGGTSSQGKRMWVVDPIDGSSNFSRGIPHFAVCVGLLENNVPVLGAVYNPVTKELFSFKKGEGAYLGGKPIHVSDVSDLAKAEIFLHAGRKKELWSWGGASYTALLEHANKTGNFGGSALDICFVAAGRIEGVVYGTLTTFDIGAALGILLEAGGCVYGRDGAPALLSDAPQKIIATNNAEIVQSLLKII